MIVACGSFDMKDFNFWILICETQGSSKLKLNLFWRPLSNSCRDFS